jgi:hypothetical protein
MIILISPESAGALLVLALTDSLSFGTLLVPVWLLMTPGRARPGRMLVYLGTVATAYLAIGCLLIAGGGILIENIDGILDSRPLLVAQLTIGLMFLALSFALDTEAARSRAARRDAGSTRISRWRERVMGEESRTAGLVTLALGAVLVEVASMLPYIAATGIIATGTSNWASAIGVLAIYCFVMTVPALVLTMGRLFFRSRAEEPLRRLDGWLSDNARGTALWIIGIAGFFLAASAIQSLGWIPS